MTTETVDRDVAAEVEKEEINELELQAYMDLDEYEIQDEKWKRYLILRYAEVRATFDKLMLNKREAEGMKQEETLNKMAPLFRANYKERKFIVKQLRKLGEKVEDKYVPF
jgi:hypothetical protein